MGYREALKARNRGIEGRAFQKSAKKKSLWSSIGKTVGGLAATALTGGAAAPWAAGLMAGAGSFVGGAVGTGVGGKVQGGSFFREEAADLNKELGAFGGENITSALKSGLTAGIGQKLKLAKSGETAAKGLDFKGSFVGKAGEKAKLSRELQQMGEGAIGTTKSIAGGTGKSILDAGPPPAPIAGARVRTPIAAGDIAGRVDIGRQQEQLGLMSKGKAPGLFRQTREGGAPALQGESLDAILQRQSAGATAADKSFTMHGGGGRGIDPSIKSTGNEFIDRQLGGVGGGVSAVQDDSLDAILQRQSATGTPQDIRGTSSRYQGWLGRQQEGQRGYEQSGTYDRDSWQDTIFRR